MPPLGEPGDALGFFRCWEASYPVEFRAWLLVVAGIVLAPFVFAVALELTDQRKARRGPR